MRRTPTAHQRGLGWHHRQVRASLLARHHDGTPCWWCAKPMYRAAAANFDRAPLEADHTVARANGGHRADRLLHRTCNRSRGKGDRDHLRPALGPQPAAQPVTTRKWW